MFVDHAFIISLFLIFSVISYIFDLFSLHAPVAQSVEQIPFKDKVVGSIPTGRTTKDFAILERQKCK